MKKAIIILFIVLMGGATLHAQNSQQNNINRDINILERVLDELFKAEWSKKDGSFSITSVHLSKGDYIWNYSKSTKVEGMYLPSYGILFTISIAKPVIYLENGNENDYYFTNGDDTDMHEPVNEQTIVERIVDFLKNYGSTINQLKPEDEITVTYKGPDYKKLLEITGDSSETFKKNRLPHVSITARMSDIKAHQRDNLSDDAFRERLKINTSKPEKNNKKDVEILSNILEAAFEDQSNEQFRINDDIEYQQIENLGALYSFEISYGNILTALNFNKNQVVKLTKNIANNADLDSLDFDINYDSLKTLKVINLSDSALVIKFDSTYLKKMQKGLKNLEVKLKSLSNDLDETSKQMGEEQKKRYTQMQQALDEFLAKLKGYMVDYGNTLNSISPDQYLLISIKVNDSAEDFPDRIILQAKKSLLQKASQGSISRQQAMDKIDVREF